MKLSTEYKILFCPIHSHRSFTNHVSFKYSDTNMHFSDRLIRIKLTLIETCLCLSSRFSCDLTPHLFSHGAKLLFSVHCNVDDKIKGHWSGIYTWNWSKSCFHSSPRHSPHFQTKWEGKPYPLYVCIDLKYIHTYCIFAIEHFANIHWQYICYSSMYWFNNGI